MDKETHILEVEAVSDMEEDIDIIGELIFLYCFNFLLGLKEILKINTV